VEETLCNMLSALQAALMPSYVLSVTTTFLEVKAV
jgi:hypothetical protein